MLSAGQTSQADNFSIATENPGDQHCDFFATVVFAILATPPRVINLSALAPGIDHLDAHQPIQFADYGFPTAAKSEAIGVTPDTRPASGPPIKGLPSDVDPTPLPVVREATCGT